MKQNKMTCSFLAYILSLKKKDAGIAVLMHTKKNYHNNFHASRKLYITAHKKSST
jgi:hypothetical protein